MLSQGAETAETAETEGAYYDSDDEIWADLRSFEELWRGDTALPCMKYHEAVDKLGIPLNHEAFNFLRRAPIGGEGARKALPEADLAFLREFEQGLVKLGSIQPAAPRA